jgi:hypothetical protein
LVVVSAQSGLTVAKCPMPWKRMEKWMHFFWSLHPCRTTTAEVSGFGISPGIIVAATIPLMGRVSSITLRSTPAI